MILASHQYLTRRQMAMASSEEQLGQILALLSENSKGINELDIYVGDAESEDEDQPLETRS